MSSCLFSFYVNIYFYVLSYPQTNKMTVGKLDDFLSMHPMPCQKHGRAICPSCSFYRECLLGRCQCTRYKFNGRVGAVCKTCAHAPSLHRRCPTQAKRKGQQVSYYFYRTETFRRKDALEIIMIIIIRTSFSIFCPSFDFTLCFCDYVTMAWWHMQTMLSIMNVPRDPDLSVPERIVGVLADDVIIRPPIANKVRYEAAKKTRREKLLNETRVTQSMDQVQLMAACEVRCLSTLQNPCRAWIVYSCISL